MLNYIFVMRTYVWSLLILILISFLGYPAAAQEDQPTQEPPQVAIHYPVSGQALQGTISITGNTLVEGFSFVELSFAYSSDLTDTWFLVYEGDMPVSDGELTQWDTSTITDGEYTLRLVVTLVDASQISVSITNLRVRNYTPIETDTPMPTATHAPGDTPVPTITLTPTVTPIPPTATALPPNPAQITAQDILLSLGKGILVIIGFFAILGLYQIIRSAARR